MTCVVRALAALLVCFAGFVGSAGAQPYPTKPVRVIVPFAPGGPTDVIARIVAQKLSENLGQQFVVENRAGAGGNIGMAAVAKAAPDGYMVLFSSSSIVVNPSLYANIPFDALKDFAPVSYVAASPNVLVVHPSVDARTVRELIALIKAGPGKFSFATPGIGTTPDLSGHLFKLALGLDLVGVPFNGAGPAITSTIGNQTPIAFTALPPTTPHVKSGALRALAVTSKTRSSALPDVPTLAEAGIADQESDTLQGVLVPAGTPKEVIDTLHREIVKSVALPDVKERLAGLGFNAVANRPEEFAAQIRAEITKWGKVVKDANIKVE